jgi:hypothetical protein
MSREGREHRQSAEADAARQGSSDRVDRVHGVPMARLDLPTGRCRQPVRGRVAVYSLRGSEARALATVGVFRVVRADDLQPTPTSRDAWRGDLRTLAEQGLIQLRTVEINRESIAVVVLTRSGQRLLEAHRVADETRAQAFYAGLVKPREIAHDAQLYRVYQMEAARIEAAGGRVMRVVLDYELKHDYQTFLHRTNRPDDADARAEAQAFADAVQLPVVDDHLELPDLRLEYETANGQLAYCDVELATEHYARHQLAAKRAAGFVIYRAAGAGRSRGASGRGRGRGGHVRRGGTPFDPHHLERL